MNQDFVSFDDIGRHVREALMRATPPVPEAAKPVLVVRDLFGRVRVCGASQDGLGEFARSLRDSLGAHAATDSGQVLVVDPALLATGRKAGREIHPGVFFSERLVTGAGWWTVAAPRQGGGASRYTLYSVKGGVGRSTTAAVLARHLAAHGRRVLVVDLDLESPGLSSAILEPDRRPDFGVTDWFVEELVGQGEQVVGRMAGAPRWAQGLDGEVRVAPAHGREPGEYLAKLGRVYMDTAGDPWAARLLRLIRRLEAEIKPDIVLVESRSGLHDIAAATVSDLDARVLLFATDSESTWTDCTILFRHWQSHGLSAKIRARLSIVSALTPELDTAQYLERFRECSWDLFREHLYDRLDSSDDPGDAFSFDLFDEDAPHHPFAIHWTRSLAAGASWFDTEPTTVTPAYGEFLARFEMFGDRE